MSFYPPQGSGGSGGSSLSGVTEDGGSPNVVAVADALNVGSADAAVAEGDLAAGTGANEFSYDASTSTLLLKGGSTSGTLSLNSGNLLANYTSVTINRTSGYFQAGGSASTSFRLQTDGSTGGRAQILDPNGVNGGRVDLLDSGGAADASVHEDSGYVALDGVNGLRVYVNGTLELGLTATALLPTTAGGLTLGSASNEWADVYTSGTIYLGEGQDAAITRSARGVIELSDPSDSAGLGMRLDFVSAAGGSPSTYYLDYDHGSSYMVASGNFQIGTSSGYRLRLGSSGPFITSGTGTPESSVTGPVGSVYLRTDGGSSTTIYIKESGTGNTGWVAK